MSQSSGRLTLEQALRVADQASPLPSVAHQALTTLRQAVHMLLRDRKRNQQKLAECGKRTYPLEISNMNANAPTTKTREPFLKIDGYRKLSDMEIYLINKIKAYEAQGIRLVQAIEDRQAHITSKHGTPDAEAKRWCAIGKTDIQKGCMALTRAVAKPEPLA